MKMYCSGIGGIGLSAYAALQHANGHTVLGSDRTLSEITRELSLQGISVFDHQDGSEVTQDIDLFVYSEAIPEDAPERKKAADLGIRQISYFQALGELSKDYTVIAVCGTHGKSTTTAMAAGVLIEAGFDPTVVVGTKVPQLDGKNWRKGNSNIFLLEACEYRGSFLHLHPNVILMTNVDGDHFDAFNSIEEYRKAFTEFILKLPDDGVCIAHLDDADSAKVLSSLDVTVIDASTCTPPNLNVAGQHMRENAKLVCALAKHVEIPCETSLASFSGTWRRMEYKGEYNGIPVIDDYAHHPKEVSATLAAISEQYPDKRIVCLFQPHMHDRTRRFYEDFVNAFTAADLVLITDVYDARPDVEDGSVDIKAFTNDIDTQAVYVGSVNDAYDYCCKNLQQNDVLIVVGAGDVTQVAQRLTKS